MTEHKKNLYDYESIVLGRAYTIKVCQHGVVLTYPCPDCVLAWYAVSNKPGANPFEPYADGSLFVEVQLQDHKGGNPVEWPEDLRVREYPSV